VAVGLEWGGVLEVAVVEGFGVEVFEAGLQLGLELKFWLLEGGGQDCRHFRRSEQGLEGLAGGGEAGG
jgi:hypothetical protein